MNKTLTEALLYEKLTENKVRCNLCAHRCLIPVNKTGICNVRQNIQGTLYSLVYGKVIAAHIDPIEKKPLFHFLPGSKSFSIATPGCNFQCGFCQNWQISQATAEMLTDVDKLLPPAAIVKSAKENNCQSISYTYTEPTIYFEYALEVSKLAKAEGIYNIFVTNGFMTPECIEMISPFLDAANIDLKSFNDSFYRKVCKGRLDPVLESIKLMKKAGIWVEITTLIVPTLNDQEEELEKLAGFIYGVGPEIPWHISRFHPDYKLTDLNSTPAAELHLAETIGKKAGLRYVYTGNIPGDKGENTVCYQCGEKLISRYGFQIRENLIKANKCPYCGAGINGVF